MNTTGDPTLDAVIQTDTYATELLLGVLSEPSEPVDPEQDDCPPAVPAYQHVGSTLPVLAYRRGVTHTAWGVVAVAFAAVVVAAGAVGFVVGVSL